MKRKSTIELLALSKVHLVAVVDVLTGYCPIDIHAVRIRTMLAATCPVFARLRLKHLGSHSFDEPGRLAGIYISRLNNFVTGLRRYAELLGSC